MKRKKINNKGFTLVELIVVLVILAILAAILVPALLGYIDDAKRKQDVLDANSLLKSTQGEIAKQYAFNNFDNLEQKSILSVSGIGQYNQGRYQIGDFQNNVFCYKYSFAKNILDRADLHPALFVVGLGQYNYYVNGKKDNNATVVNESYKNIHKAYTVYFAIYMADKDSEPLFYDGKTWTEFNPWDDTINAVGTSHYEKNKIVVNGETTYIQLYEIGRDVSYGEPRKNYYFWDIWKKNYNN